MIFYVHLAKNLVYAELWLFGPQVIAYRFASVKFASVHHMNIRTSDFRQFSLFFHGQESQWKEICWETAPKALQQKPEQCAVPRSIPSTLVGPAHIPNSLSTDADASDKRGSSLWMPMPKVYVAVPSPRWVLAPYTKEISYGGFILQGLCRLLPPITIQPHRPLLDSSKPSHQTWQKAQRAKRMIWIGAQIPVPPVLRHLKKIMLEQRVKLSRSYASVTTQKLQKLLQVCLFFTSEFALLK
jgi:hypothetical protein